MKSHPANVLNKGQAPFECLLSNWKSANSDDYKKKQDYYQDLQDNEMIRVELSIFLVLKINIKYSFF